MKNDMLDIYSDYLIAQTAQASATGLSHLLKGTISHDKVTRFLNKNAFSSKDLWRYVKPTIRKHEEDKGGVLIIDDTIEEKPCTDENDIVNWHFSHTRGRCVKGVNILSCIIRYGDIAVPIGFEIVHKEQHFCDLKTRKEIRKSTISKNESFRDMVSQAQSNKILFDHVLADSWFASKENMKFIHNKIRKKFILGLKSNRLCAFSKAEAKKGQHQAINELDLKDGVSRKVWLKDLSFPVQLIKKVFKNENGTTGTLYLVTNDLHIDADQIYLIYQKRWRVEEYHKYIKQNSSLEKSLTCSPKVGPTRNRGSCKLLKKGHEP